MCSICRVNPPAMINKVSQPAASTYSSSRRRRYSSTFVRLSRRSSKRNHPVCGRIHRLIEAANQGARPAIDARGRLAREIIAAYEGFYDRLRDPDIRQSPELGHYLRALLRDPLDRDALRFFKLLRPAPPEDPVGRHADESRDYLSLLRGGGNLLSLITAEGDITFGYTTDPRRIVLEHRGKRYTFLKGPSIVRDIVEAILRIKPESLFIDEKEPVSGTSYDDLLGRVALTLSQQESQTGPGMCRR